MSEDKHRKIFSAGGGQNQDILKGIIVGLLGFVAVVLIFSVGMHVGGSRAKYSYSWAESYHTNFAGPRSGFLGNWRAFPQGDFISGHGAFGGIIELNDTGFVIQGRGDVEKVIIITNDTIIKRGRETMAVEVGLQVGDKVTVIGSPNDEGQIEAKLIRIFDDGRDKSSYMNKGFRHRFF